MFPSSTTLETTFRLDRDHGGQKTLGQRWWQFRWGLPFEWPWRCVSYVGERSASDDELAFGTFRFSQLSIDPQFITVLQTARFLSSILCATHALNSRLHCLRPCKSNWLFIGAFKLGWPTHPDWSRLDAGESMLRNLNNFKMPKLIYLEYIRTGPSSAG